MQRRSVECRVLLSSSLNLGSWMSQMAAFGLRAPVSASTGLYSSLNKGLVAQKCLFAAPIVQIKECNSRAQKCGFLRAQASSALSSVAFKDV